MMFFNRPRRDNGSLVKFVKVRDDEVLYQQFESGTKSATRVDLFDHIYGNLKDCRQESQTASKQALLSFAVLICLQFGVVQSVSFLGAAVENGWARSSVLLCTSALSLRSGYALSRVSLLRGVFSAHFRRLDYPQRSYWLVRYPLAYSAFSMYSTALRWPRFLNPENQRPQIELGKVMFIAVGAISAGLLSLYVLGLVGWSVLEKGNFSLLSIAIVASSAIMSFGAFLFPKYSERQRLYQHSGLLHLMARLDRSEPARRERYLRKIGEAQRNLGRLEL